LHPGKKPTSCSSTTIRSWRRRTHDIRAAFIANLRQKLPAIKVIAIHLDPWAIDRSILVKTAADLACRLAHFPRQSGLERPSSRRQNRDRAVSACGNLGKPVTPLAPQ